MKKMAWIFGTLWTRLFGVITNYNCMSKLRVLKFSHSILGLPLYGVLGPYAAIGINGKDIIDIYSGGISERNVYKNQFDSNGLWKRLDYGLQAGAGIQFGKYVFELNYSYGLANISRHSPHVEKNRIIGLTLGYKFKTRNPSP